MITFWMQPKPASHKKFLSWIKFMQEHQHRLMNLSLDHSQALRWDGCQSTENPSTLCHDPIGQLLLGWVNRFLRDSKWCSNIVCFSGKVWQKAAWAPRSRADWQTGAWFYMDTGIFLSGNGKNWWGQTLARASLTVECVWDAALRSEFTNSEHLCVKSGAWPACGSLFYKQQTIFPEAGG